MAESAGIMSGAFFVSKGEILKWLNDFFDAGYQKIEQCCTGVIHCMIADSIFGDVPLHKLKWDAKFDYEYVANFKVLQDTFTKHGIKKYIDVDKLVKGKYQDNLEFIQWMKNFWDNRYGGQEYDAAQRKAAAMAKSGKKPSGLKKVSVPKKVAAKPAAAASVAKPKVVAKKPAAEKKESSDAGGGADPEVVQALEAEIAELKEKIAKYKPTLAGLEKERNFYFGKLREIEVVCQEDEEVDTETKQAVLAILYKTDDNDEFEAPADEEEVEEVEVEEEEEVEEEVY